MHLKICKDLLEQTLPPKSVNLVHLFYEVLLRLLTALSLDNIID